MAKERDFKDIIGYWMCLIVIIIFSITLNSSGQILQILLFGKDLEGRVVNVDNETMTIEVIIDDQVFQIKKYIKDRTKEAKVRYKKLDQTGLRHYEGQFVVYMFNEHVRMYMQLTLLLGFLLFGIKYFPPIRFSESSKENILDQ